MQLAGLRSRRLCDKHPSLASAGEGCFASLPALSLSACVFDCPLLLLGHCVGVHLSDRSPSLSSASELKKLASSVLYPHIKDVAGDFWVGTDGVLHRHDGKCVPRPASKPEVADSPYAAIGGYSSPRNTFVHPPVPANPGVPGSHKQVPFSVVVSAERCERCTSYGFMWQSNLDKSPLIRAVETFEDARTRLVSALKVTKSTSASALQRRLDDLKYHSGVLERTISSSSFPAGMREAFEALLEEVEAARVSLQSTSRSDVARDKVSEKLRELMVPKRFKGQSIQLDESLCIIGISPAPRGRAASTQVAAAIEAYSIRNDTAAVLVAPAFVYSFLLQQLFPKGSSDVLVVSAPAPVEEQVRETAAGIWDPEGASSLACMQAAIDAARAITG